jgi:hypothetical protein
VAGVGGGGVATLAMAPRRLRRVPFPPNNPASVKGLHVRGTRKAIGGRSDDGGGGGGGGGGGVGRQRGQEGWKNARINADRGKKVGIMQTR